MGLGDLGAVLQIVNDIAGAAGVNVLAAEDHLREALALLFGQLVPELAAMHIEEHLVAQVGATDAQGNHHIHIVLHMSRELTQALQGAGAVQVAFLHIGQLAEQNLLRLAILGEMSADKALLAHDLHGLMSLLQIFLVALEISLGDFAFAIEIVIVKSKAGFQLQTHLAQHSFLYHTIHIHKLCYHTLY